MSDTLSTPDPALQVAEVRQIIDGRAGHSCESTLLAIRRVVDPPPPAKPLEHDPRGWVKLEPGGTAWERHDDPHPEL